MKTITYDKFAELLSTNNFVVKSAQEAIDTFISEPVAYKVKAEPGWSVLIGIPYENNRSDILVETISVTDWAFFTSLTLYGKESSIKRAIINAQYEHSMPVMDINNAGSASEFILSIKNKFPNWHCIMPPSLILGCYHISDSRSISELKEQAKKFWKKTQEQIIREEEILSKLKNGTGSLSNVLESAQNIIDSALIKKPDGSKLN